MMYMSLPRLVLLGGPVQADLLVTEPRGRKFYEE
jgi:hypothetical protein